MGADPSPGAPPPVPPASPALNPPGLLTPGAIGPTGFDSSASMPSMQALPASTGPASGSAPVIDASNYRKFYTITAELRETYDTNVDTTPHAQSGYETTISPSILVDFPRENWELSASYTFGLVEYIESAAAGGDNLQYYNQFNAQYRHDFSERFSVNASDAFNDSTEPNVFGATGTPYRDGENISNAFTSGLSYQWTPLVGTQTTYANTLVRYLSSEFATTQDSDENTASQTISFSVLPKINASVGGIVDNITYQFQPRGYTDFTAFIGGQWQVLPSITVSARGGGTYTLLGGAGGDSLAPYGDVSGSWQLGKRSSLTADYSHQVTPTDQQFANGQETDRVSANFSYDITTRLTSHFEAIYSYNVISGGFINSTIDAYDESDYAVDTGMSYNFDKYFSTNFDISVTGVSSQLAFRDYSRDQFSIGVRGTY
jgi:hypothetical protein